MSKFKRNYIISFANYLTAFSLVIYLFAYSSENYNLILFFVFISSLLASTISISMVSSVKQAFRDKDLVRINGLVSIIENYPIIAGPTLGALVYSFHLENIFISSAVIVSIFAGFIFGKQDWPEPKNKVKLFGPDLLNGFRFIYENKGLFSLQGIFSAYNFFSGISASAIAIFLMKFPSEMGSKWNIAANSTLAGIGILLGGALVATLGRGMSHYVSIFGSMALASVLSRILVPFFDNIYLVIILLFTRSVLSQISNSSLTAIWQNVVPDDKQPAVFGSRRFLGQGPYPISLIIGGVLVELFGAENIFYILIMSGILELICSILLIKSPARQLLK